MSYVKKKTLIRLLVMQDEVGVGSILNSTARLMEFFWLG
jgi:hypothetical protein